MKIKRLFLVTIILSLILTAVFSVLAVKRKSKTKDEIPNVSICKIEQETISPTIDTFGTIMFRSKNDVTCLQSGKVESKLVNVGDYVKKGQILYILKNNELEIQLSQYMNNLNSSIANISLYEAKLEERKRTVKSNLLQIENKALEIENLKTQIQNLNDKLEKSRELEKLGGISEQVLHDNEIEYLQMCNTLKILEQEQHILSLGYTTESLNENGIIPSDDPILFEKQIVELNTKSAQADLTVAKAEYENAEKNVTLLKKLIDDLTIKSPITGIIGATYFEKEEHVNGNEKILTIMDTSTCIASIALQELNINSVQIGMETTVSIPSINKEYHCSISEISPYSDSSTGNFTVNIFIDNPDFVLKPGMFAKCCISTKNEETYFKLPETSLFNISGNRANYFIVSNNIAIQESLDFEFIKNGYAYSTYKFNNDSSIIISPSTRIKDGTRVKTM